MRPRGPRIGEKTRHKSDPKRNPLQISFLELFGTDFCGFSDGFGKVLGMSLEAWRSIFQGFLGASPKPQETTRRHRKSSIWSASAASERAQRAKRAERLRCSKGYSSGFLEGFTETTDKNTTSQEKRKSQNALPVPLLRQVYVGAGFASQDAPKTPPRRAKTRPRRAKTRQVAHRMGHRRPKRPPRGVKTRPRRPKMPPEPPRTAKMFMLGWFLMVFRWFFKLFFPILEA